MTLQGRVQDVSTVGVLHVHHQPVFRLPFSGWVHRLRSVEQEKGKFPLSETFLEVPQILQNQCDLVGLCLHCRPTFIGMPGDSGHRQFRSVWVVLLYHKQLS